MKVVIITGNKYPLEDAGAIRQHSTAKLFKLLGYDPLVLGYGKPTHGKVEVYDDIEFVSFRPSSKSVVVRALYRYFFINRVIKYINKNIDAIDVFLVIDVLPKDFSKIVKLAERYNAKLIHDSVEWYSPEEFSNEEKNRSYRNKEYTNTIAIGNNWRVIAISKFLENHFKNRCQNVIRIPVIMDVFSIEPILNKVNNKVIFVYAGGPGKKDYLKTIISGFIKLNDSERNQVEFHIIGVNKEQLINLCGIDSNSLDELNDILFVHGRLSHDDAVKYVKNASYTIMLRNEDLRYSKAGFPTKVVESLSYGTPVLCNLSSDLKDYLVNLENSVIVSGHNDEDVYKGIVTTLNINNSDYIKMRGNARKTAERYFDYREYVDSLSRLLS